MSRQFRLLNDAALTSICDAARQLPETERPVFVRLCSHRFVSNNASLRLLDLRAAQLITQIDQGNFCSDVNAQKEKLSIKGSAVGTWT